MACYKYYDTAMFDFKYKLSFGFMCFKKQKSSNQSINQSINQLICNVILTIDGMFQA